MRVAATAGAIAVLLLVAAPRAEAPLVYAIVGARIVTAAGPAIDNGTVVLRDGLIEAVGRSVTAPADARIIDGKGLTVYPGLIDLGTAAGLDVPTPPQPANPTSREVVERWKRQVILRPQVHAARYLKADADDLPRLGAVGITSVLSTPPGEVVRGHSALVNIMAAPDEPQIGAVADDRQGPSIIRSPVLLHVSFSERPRGAAYPLSLMGVIAFVRQAFVDAEHYRVEAAHAERVKRGAQPAPDEVLEALQGALARRLPVAFEASTAVAIRRALGLAREFRLDPVIEGGHDASEVAGELKAQGARVLFSLNYPQRPSTLAPEAEEPVRELRRRANAPKTPLALHTAGVRFGFASAGLRDPKDFIRNAAKAVQAGLPADAAIRALTIEAAAIAGAADRLGSVEKGKIANVIVTEGDLFDPTKAITHVFVGGRLVAPPTTERPDTGRRGASGG